LSGAFYRAPGKDFAECKPGTRQRKVAVTESLRQPLLCRVPYQRRPTKIFFFKISLSGAAQRGHPAKSFFYFFFRIFFSEYPIGEASDKDFSFLFAGCCTVVAPSKEFFLLFSYFLCRVPC
jgi:hypothetical protein